MFIQGYLGHLGIDRPQRIPSVALERLRRPVHGPMFYTYFSKDDARLSTRMATRNAVLAKSNKTAWIKIGS